MMLRYINKKGSGCFTKLKYVKSPMAFRDKSNVLRTSSNLGLKIILL